MRLISSILVFFVFLPSCIDPYTPDLDDYSDLLVVDAQIAPGVGLSYVRLSRTSNEVSGSDSLLSGAVVTIIENGNAEFNFEEDDPGIYLPSESSFTPEPGNDYSLRILTADGELYESETVEMIPVPDIGRLWFEKDKRIVESVDREMEGVSIYLNTEDESGRCQYYRWEYDELWEFTVPYPVFFEYIDEDTILYVPPVNQYCWKRDKSTGILIQSTEGLTAPRIQGYHLDFKAPALSDRLNILYSINVRQFSMTEEEYSFWEKLRINNQDVGDIFEKQPVIVNSNVYNVDDDEEKVVGYFRVSDLKEKRLFIDREELYGMDFNYWRMNCDVFEFYLANPPPGYNYLSFNEAYEALSYSRNFIGPLLNEFNQLIGLAFASFRCSDCSRSGDPERPEFWPERSEL